MKSLGLLGADSVDATAVYGGLLAGEMRHRFGHGRNIRLVMLNLQTPELAAALTQQDFSATGELLSLGAKQLVTLGATAVVVCTSRLQPAAARLALDVPLLSMTDAVGAALQTLRLKRVGLVGATSTNEEAHWRKCLARYQVIDLFVPVLRDREHLAYLTIEELQQGVVNQTTRADVGRIVYSLRQAGARAIVLVSPALGLALSHHDPVLPVLDATELHALAALDWSLNATATSLPIPLRKSPREKRPRNHATTQD
ncbi:MAG: aspartate/glutamate racemase family protein [Lacunisphaera sp.]|nr:aspartate/glutamate racemase family protein [Lacunisphaera sp.]